MVGKIALIVALLMLTIVQPTWSAVAVILIIALALALDLLVEVRRDAR